MEELLVQIGELIMTEVEQVTDIKYLDNEMGAMFMIYLQDGKKVLLSLIGE